MPVADTAADSWSTTDRRVLESIHGNIEPVRSSAVYLVGLIVVALTMVSLPLIYLALIALTAYGVWWHMVGNVSLFQDLTLRVSVIAYFGPLVGGVAMVFFMIKPLFAPAAEPDEAPAISREDEPLLFEFVDRLAAAVNAPAPREIRLDHQVNASASLRRGLQSVAQRDLVLTIGLPLVRGMSLRQFGGVLAHEFGHFSQHAGMGLTYIIRSVNAWFSRVVYGRDEWDDELAKAMRGTGNVGGAILGMAVLLVWLTRKILWVLMMFGHAISCFLLRQMEYDADRHECRFAGSEVFESTSQRLVELSVAGQLAWFDLTTFFEEGRLVDNYPELIVNTAGRIPAELRARVEEEEQDSRTGFFDTHPCTRDRIARAREEEATGVYRLPPPEAGGSGPTDLATEDLPATTLFRDYVPLESAVSVTFFETVLGRDVDSSELHAVSSMVRRRDQDVAAGEALERYCMGHYPPRPFDPADAGSMEFGESQLGDAIARARERMLGNVADYKEAVGQWATLEGLLRNATLAKTLLDAELRFSPAELGLSGSDHASLNDDRRRAEEGKAALEARLEPFEGALIERFTAALRAAISVEQRRERELRPGVRVAELIATAGALCHVDDALEKVRDNCAEISALYGARETDDSPRVGEMMSARIATARTSLLSVSEQLATVRYPFEHAKADISVGEYAIPEKPGQSFEQVWGAAQQAIERLQVLRQRVMSRLAQVAEEAESEVFDMKPLPAPPE